MASLKLVKTPEISIESHISFVTLKKDNKFLFNLLREYFLKNIEPLYGDQSKILKKIWEGQDRTCEFLSHLNRISGMVVYKHHCSNEFVQEGIEEGIEIKTIFLMNKNIKTAGLLIRHLLSRPARKALDLGASCLFGTISAKKPDVLRVMCKLGFEIVKTFSGKYIPGVDEYLVCHSSPFSLLTTIPPQKRFSSRTTKT